MISTTGFSGIDWDYGAACIIKGEGVQARRARLFEG
jgi:hypothetical protein